VRGPGSEEGIRNPEGKNEHGKSKNHSIYSRWECRKKGEEKKQPGKEKSNTQSGGRKNGSLAGGEKAGPHAKTTKDNTRTWIGRYFAGPITLRESRALQNKRFMEENVQVHTRKLVEKECFEKGGLHDRGCEFADSSH